MDLVLDLDLDSRSFEPALLFTSTLGDLDLDSLLPRESDLDLDLVRLAGDRDLYDLDLERDTDFLARFRLESSKLVDLDLERRTGE